jgi:hypothetical protein
MNHMKQSVFLVLLSFGIIIGAQYVGTTLHWLNIAHTDLLQGLGQIFTHNRTGSLLAKLIAVFAIPVLLTALIAAIYGCFKRHLIPHVWLYVWAFWLILATMLIVQG